MVFGACVSYYPVIFAAILRDLDVDMRESVANLKTREHGKTYVRIADAHARLCGARAVQVLHSLK